MSEAEDVAAQIDGLAISDQLRVAAALLDGADSKGREERARLRKIAMNLVLRVAAGLALEAQRGA